MELLMEQYENDESEKTCEEYTPKVEKEENYDTSDYDYHKRLWF